MAYTREYERAHREFLAAPVEVAHVVPSDLKPSLDKIEDIDMGSEEKVAFVKAQYRAVRARIQAAKGPCPVQILTEDAILHGPHADTHLFKLKRDPANEGGVTVHRVRPKEAMKASTELQAVRDALENREGPFQQMPEEQLAVEHHISTLLDPLKQCKEPSRTFDKIPKCAYYICDRCGKEKLFNELILFASSANNEPLPLGFLDEGFSKKQSLLESIITEVQVTEAHIIQHFCQACYQHVIEQDHMTEAKFHKCRLAATAAIARQQDGITRVTKDDYQTLGRKVYNCGRDEFKSPLDHASEDRTPGLLEYFMNHGKGPADGNPGEEPTDGNQEELRLRKKGAITTPIVVKMLKYMLQHPEQEMGLPSLATAVTLLRGKVEKVKSNLMNLALTSTDYLSLVLCAAGPDNTLDTGPKIVLKYIQARSGHYDDPIGEQKYLPMGYMPDKDRFWTPMTAGKHNFWADPAMGLDIDRARPYVLIFDPGHIDMTKPRPPVEVYLASDPPHHVKDLLVICKCHTNGIFRMKAPETLLELWTMIVRAMENSDKITAMVLKQLHTAKFIFRLKDITSMEEWTRKKSLVFTSQDKQLGITQAMLKSRMQASGYDLSKVQGYSPGAKISAKGWLEIKLLLMQMMELADFRELSQGLAGEGKSLTKAQMKMLEQCLERKSSAGGSSGSGAH